MGCDGWEDYVDMSGLCCFMFGIKILLQIGFVLLFVDYVIIKAFADVRGLCSSLKLCCCLWVRVFVEIYVDVNGLFCYLRIW